MSVDEEIMLELYEYGNRVVVERRRRERELDERIRKLSRAVYE